MTWKNQHKPGNMAVLVNAPAPGLKTLEDVVEAGGQGLVFPTKPKAAISALAYGAFFPT